MGDVCTDDRFEVIAAYKKKLIESTNIETSPGEMAVIDNVLFRFWQMGWLPPVPHGRLIDADKITFVESENGCQDDYAFRYDINEMPTIMPAEENHNDD